MVRARETKENSAAFIGDRECWCKSLLGNGVREPISWETGSGNQLQIDPRSSLIHCLPFLDLLRQIVFSSFREHPHLFRYVAGTPHGQPLGNPRLPQCGFSCQRPSHRDPAQVASRQPREMTAVVSLDPEVPFRLRNDCFRVAYRMVPGLTTTAEVFGHWKVTPPHLIETFQKGILERFSAPIPVLSQGALQGLSFEREHRTCRGLPRSSSRRGVR